MFEKNKYYICKKCKEVNDEELNTFITHVFHNTVTIRPYSRGNASNYCDYEAQTIMEFHVGGVYKCMIDNYLIDDKGQFVYIGKLDGFLFEEVEIDLNGCEKIIDAIEKHYGCSASVKPWTVNEYIMEYICYVKLCSVNGKCVASGCNVSKDPVNGLLTAYRNARKALATSGELNKAIHSYIGSYTYTYKFL